MTFKNIYQHAHDQLSYLVEEKGFFLPGVGILSGSDCNCLGTLIVILSQQLKIGLEKNCANRAGSLPSQCAGIKESICIGIYYPSRCVASLWVWEVLLLISLHDKLRFQWRFKGKQEWDRSYKEWWESDKLEVVVVESARLVQGEVYRKWKLSIWAGWIHLHGFKWGSRLVRWKRMVPRVDAPRSMEFLACGFLLSERLMEELCQLLVKAPWRNAS